MKGYPEGHYKSVAEVHAEAVLVGATNPTQAVQQTWAVPHSTAAVWVKRARMRGLIPPRRVWQRQAAANRPTYNCRGCQLHCPAEHGA